MNVLSKLKKIIVLTIGVAVIILGVYLWYQSGFTLAGKGDPNTDTGVEAPIYLIILGASIFGYGIFMHS